MLCRKEFRLARFGATSARAVRLLLRSGVTSASAARSLSFVCAAPFPCRFGRLTCRWSGGSAAACFCTDCCDDEIELPELGYVQKKRRRSVAAASWSFATSAAPLGPPFATDFARTLLIAQRGARRAGTMRWRAQVG